MQQRCSQMFLLLIHLSIVGSVRSGYLLKNGPSILLARLSTVSHHEWVVISSSRNGRSSGLSSLWCLIRISCPQYCSSRSGRFHKSRTSCKISSTFSFSEKGCSFKNERNNCFRGLPLIPKNRKLCFMYAAIACASATSE